MLARPLLLPPMTDVGLKTTMAFDKARARALIMRQQHGAMAWYVNPFKEE